MLPLRPVGRHARRNVALFGAFAVLCTIWTGCKSSATLGSNAARPYQWEALSHHPELAWHRYRADSAAVYVQLPAHEPLHLRENRNLPFRYSLEIDLLVQVLELSAGDTSGSFLPTRHRFSWQGDAHPDVTQLTGRFTFPLPAGRYRITHLVRDVHRGSEVSGAMLMDAGSVDAPIRSLAFDAETGAPAWDMRLPSGGTLALLVPPDLSDGLWSRAALPPVDSFPSAPFLDRRPMELTFPEPVERVVPTPVEAGTAVLPEGQWKGWSVLLWKGDAGIHRWSVEGSQRMVTLPVRRPHFPAMRDVDEMIRATRFIATRDEYRSMREARDPKKALDNFWLQFAGSTDDARKLIREYYGRVLEANVHFSGLREGWCTDRGMVHIVFGHPDQAQRDRYGETWVYGEEGDINALIFRFSARGRGDDFNVFELERYPGFRSSWEAMISSWRRGKIRRR